MWSDEIDKKIKETTEGYHPAYDDKAWDKMELLLDKHLPPEKKRRRFILLLLPLLLMGTAVFFMLQQHKKGVSEEKNTFIQPLPDPKQTTKEAGVAAPSSETDLKPGTSSGTTGLATTTKDQTDGIKAQKQFVRNDVNDNNSPKQKQTTSKQLTGQQQNLAERKYQGKTGSKEKDIAEQKDSPSNSPVTGPQNNTVSSSIAPATNEKPESMTQKDIAVGQKKETDSSNVKEAVTENKTIKQKTSHASKFSLNLSAGPDISSVGIDNTGQWKLQYGIGVSYAVSKKLSIRTGFFAGHKKYSADSTEYHSTYYARLQKVDADCLVFEVPVNLIYNFPVNKKHNWFIAGGLSSYFMKREVYDYYYKDPWGQTKFSRYEYKSKNSHIFSVINLSGGYQYHFTDRFSLMAEPYVRIPVSGIGSGKVKLNSGGVLFSLGFKPFLKKN